MMKNVEDVYPLSPMQQLMLVHSLSTSQTEMHCVQFICRIGAPLDIETFVEAWNRVIDRHQALRTTFLCQGFTKPLQIVRQRLHLPLKHLDWRRIAPSEQEKKMKTFLSTDRRRQFNLQKGPLMRLALLRISEDAYQFVWSFHHLLLDGWSYPIVLKDALTFYEALRDGREPLLERPRPYKDYIAWLQKQDFSQAEAYWRRTLKGFAIPTPLPISAPESGKTLTDLDGIAVRRVCLDAKLLDDLHLLSRQQQITLNTIFLGAWALLLGRCSGRRDVVFGATVSGRPPDLDGVENMIGLFINVLPVRVRLTDEMFLLPWLKMIQEQRLEAQPYHFTPLDQAQEWSDVSPPLSLFDSLLVFENYPVDRSFETQDVAEIPMMQEMGGSTIIAKYPVTLVAHPGRRMVLEFYYERSRLDDSSVRTMLDSLTALLEEMTSSPNRNLGLLQIKELASLHDSLEAPEAAGGVDLKCVEAALKRHPRIHNVKVILREDTHEKNRAVVYFVAERETCPTTSELCLYLRKELPGRLLPSDFVWMEALPTGLDGDVDSRSLLQPETLYCWNRSREKSFYSSLSDTLEIELAQFCEDTLGIRPVGAADDFFDLGGSSILAVRLMTKIQERFEQDLPLSTLLHNRTVKELANVLRNQRKTSTPSLVVPIQPRGKKPPIFCFHPVGGNVLCYVDLARRLDLDQPVYGIEAMGLRPDEEPKSTIEEMAALYVEAIREILPEGPYLLLGLSFGGYLAYEVAQQMRSRGMKVGPLFLLDTWALRCGGRFAYNFDGSGVLVGQAIVIARNFRGKRLTLDKSSIIGLTLGEQVDYVMERMELSDAIPLDIGSTQLRRVLTMHSMNADALRNYTPLPYPGHVTLFRAKINTNLDYIANHPALRDPHLGWDEYLAEPLEIYDVPGDHGMIVYEPYVEVLARHLTHCLEKA